MVYGTVVAAHKQHGQRTLQRFGVSVYAEELAQARQLDGHLGLVRVGHGHGNERERTERADPHLKGFERCAASVWCSERVLGRLQRRIVTDVVKVLHSHGQFVRLGVVERHSRDDRERRK